MSKTAEAGELILNGISDDLSPNLAQFLGSNLDQPTASAPYATPSRLLAVSETTALLPVAVDTKGPVSWGLWYIRGRVTRSPEGAASGNAEIAPATVDTKGLMTWGLGSIGGRLTRSLDDTSSLWDTEIAPPGPQGTLRILVVEIYVLISTAGPTFL